jgi:hypothetical protein
MRSRIGSRPTSPGFSRMLQGERDLATVSNLIMSSSRRW